VKEGKVGQQIVSLNPFRCRMWDVHDRSEEQITEQTCRHEISNIKKYGQLVPVLGRTLKGDPEYDVELIYGARRLFVARHLNIPLRAEIRDVPDREAIVAMDAENRHRKDISPYERGLSYLKWLREGFFPTQEDIANELKISASQVSRLIKMARLPAVIVDAFQSPVEICEGWAHELSVALEDSRRRECTIRRAREIAARRTRPPAQEVCRILLAAPDGGRKTTARNRDTVVLSNEGVPLFRIRNTRTSVVLLLPTQVVSAAVLSELSGALQGIMEKHVRRPQRVSAAASGSTAVGVHGR
jgi:ParB family chromosome partitioning protein